VNAPELLTLALLLDRRAGRAGDDTAIVGVVRPAVERLQLPADARQSVELLVARRHEVARLAFRNDVSDAGVVTQLARLAGNDQRLKMLCLAAFAHTPQSAAGTAGWQHDLLWNFFVAARHRVMLGAAADRLQPSQAHRAIAVAGRPEDLSEAELSQFLDGLPERYFSVFGIADVYSHARSARTLGRDDVQTSLARHDEVWTLTVLSQGKRQLFAAAAAALAQLGAEVHRALAITTPDHLVIDRFDFSDAGDVLGRSPAAASELARLIQAAAENPDEPEPVLESTGSRLAVSVSHERADRHTVVDLSTDGTNGLLHRACRAVASLGCDVDFAAASTDGLRARDVLHVTRHGRRLSEEDREELSRRLTMI
jgi:UTP:GlnB (protein PII) uridylyltransferase